MHMKALISGNDLSKVYVNLMTARDWYNLGVDLRARLKKRTRQDNEDADGVAFEPYSEGYARAKAKHGGMVGGGRVNLTSSKAGSHMLDTITLITRGQANPRIEMYFALADKAKIANYHMEDGRVLRKFFALSDKDIDWAIQYVKDRFAGRTTKLFT